MNTLKVYQKILIVNLFLCMVVTVAFSLSDSYHGGFSDYAIAFGVCCLIAGGLNLLAGFITLIAGQANWRDGFFISAGILLLVSGISCGTGLA